MGAFSGYKYKMTDETKVVDGRVVHRIVATRDFDVRWPLLSSGGFAELPVKSVIVGEKGGWIEKEDNLCQMGGAWVADNAVVYDHALVMGEALVSGGATVGGYTTVHEGAWVRGSMTLVGAVIIGEHKLIDGTEKNKSVPEPRKKAKTVKSDDIRKVIVRMSLEKSIKYIKKSNSIFKDQLLRMCQMEKHTTMTVVVEGKIKSFMSAAYSKYGKPKQFAIKRIDEHTAEVTRMF